MSDRDVGGDAETRSTAVRLIVAAAAVVAVGITVARCHGSDADESIVPASGDRTVVVYSLVLEHFLNHRLEAEGGVPDAVRILVRPQEDAGWVGRPEVGDPIPPDVRDAISDTLAELTTVSWVTKYPPTGPDDTVVRLGLLPPGDQVNVSVSAYRDSEGWLNTYVLAQENGAWSITGAGTPIGVT